MAVRVGLKEIWADGRDFMFRKKTTTHIDIYFNTWEPQWSSTNS